jgi:hypothetical protein
LEKANSIIENKELQEAEIEALKKDRDERIKELRETISKLEISNSSKDLEKTNLKNQYDIL